MMRAMAPVVVALLATCLTSVAFAHEPPSEAVLERLAEAALPNDLPPATQPAHNDAPPAFISQQAHSAPVEPVLHQEHEVPHYLRENDGAGVRNYRHSPQHARPNHAPSLFEAAEKLPSPPDISSTFDLDDVNALADEMKKAQPAHQQKMQQHVEAPEVLPATAAAKDKDVLIETRARSTKPANDMDAANDHYYNSHPELNRLEKAPPAPPRMPHLPPPPVGIF